MREFLITEDWARARHPIITGDVCRVCLKVFEIGQRFVLAPIQASKTKGLVSLHTIPIHTDCYYVE